MSNRRIKCPACGGLLTVPPGSEGRSARCCLCSHKFRIEPEPTPAEAITSWLEGDHEPHLDEMALLDQSKKGDTLHSEPALTDQSGEPAAKAPAEQPLRLVRLDRSGALFEFPAAKLHETAFRCAMPRRCLRCGAQAHLRAHVIIYAPALVDSVSLEAEHSAGALVPSDAEVRDLTDEQLLTRLPRVPNIPHPGDLPMPYWLCDMCTGAGMLFGQIQVNSQTGVGWCRLLLRNLWRAEEFALTAGGPDCPGCKELHKLNEQRREHPWDTMPEVVQHRIEQWFKPRDGEQFLAYVPDRDHVRTEDGMSGILLSDQRLVFHSRMRHLEADQSGAIQLELAMGTTHGHVLIKTPSWEIKRFAVDRAGIAAFRRALTLGKYRAVWR